MFGPSVFEHARALCAVGARSAREDYSRASAVERLHARDDEGDEFAVNGCRGVERCERSTETCFTLPRDRGTAEENEHFAKRHVAK